MKKVIWFLLVFQFMYQQILAGSISGEISYSGNSMDTIFIAAFTSPSLEGEPAYLTTIEMPGYYQLNNLPDGTYYIVSIMSENSENIIATDPFGFWQTSEGLAPVVISSNGEISGINITLVDGTTENPNPFAEYFYEPDQIIQLPVLTEAGINPSMVFDGSLIYLYKHDSAGAPSAKVYTIIPETGEIINTINLILESLPNRISWIDKMVYCGEVLWAVGGYGDPAGSGYKDGIFQVDLSTSNSSNQIPFSKMINSSNGLACDGMNFYLAIVDTFGVEGVVKFRPDEVSEIPSEKFIDLGSQHIQYLCFGNDLLWLGINNVEIFDPVSGQYIDSLDLSGSSAELYFDNKFWSYDEIDNSIRIYYNPTVHIKTNNTGNFPSEFLLSQNYPNPFNPTTQIYYSIPSDGHVTLSIYDALGEEVAVLENGYKPAGNYSHLFDAAYLTSGIYFYTIRTNNFLQTKKMLLIK